ncbi:MAG: cytochrome P450 [Ferrovibrio sp.]|uniref:cytochrome P450 n=1 Tax=Ferrovibrio sp. TaxID=1917215 RepID=UPI00260586DE|nr:cytochrome P450 [Ferrovibrio sp.]MCW0232928.1 cytochrome P450 [Ferrovibrio sp.]
MTALFDARNAAVIADPYPALARLRETDPVHWDARLGGWLLTRYDDIRRSLRDPRLSSDRMRPFFAHLPEKTRDGMADLGAHMALWAVFNDPPDHTRLRGLMNRAFTTSAVAALRPKVATIVDGLVDTLLQEPETDFIARFAYPLPATVIALLIGVPLEDVELLKQWSDDLGSFVLASRLSADKYSRANAAIREMNAYFGDLAEARRRNPTDDVASAMVAAQQRGDFLNRDELVAACVLLLFAGHETTTHLLGNGMLALLRHPAQMQALRAGRGNEEQVSAAVEEMLRWDGPSLAQVRVVAAEYELGGKVMQPGDRVFQMLAAANRDPETFVDPDRFDIARADSNRHLTFGFGIHFCLGAPLARLEGQVAFPILLERLRDIALAAPPDWSDSIVVRGLNGLQIRCIAA